MCKILIVEINQKLRYLWNSAATYFITTKSLFVSISVFFLEESPTQESPIFECLGDAEAQNQTMIPRLFLESISMSKYPTHPPNLILTSTLHIIKGKKHINEFFKIIFCKNRTSQFIPSLDMKEKGISKSNDRIDDESFKEIFFKMTISIFFGDVNVGSLSSIISVRESSFASLFCTRNIKMIESLRNEAPIGCTTRFQGG